NWVCLAGAMSEVGRRSVWTDLAETSAPLGELDGSVHRVVGPEAPAHGDVKIAPSSPTVRPATPRPPRTTETPRGLVFSRPDVMPAFCTERSTVSRDRSQRHTRAQ